MLHTQAAVFKFVETVDPLLFEKIKKYVQEGRIELAGGMWVEGDTNLSSGEAISRSFLLGQRYFLNHFGKISNVGWLPDNFGHISQLPQILNLSNCNYFYFHRCRPTNGTFWWEGSDGSKLLCYSNTRYNGVITMDLKDEIDKIVPQKRRLMHIAGICDHGGGPTRAEIETLHQLKKTPGHPEINFTTAEDFFAKSLNEMSGRPTYKGEMQFAFEGCYTSVAGIKEGNRKCENSLYQSEFMNTLLWLSGQKYPANELRDLWANVTFNEFHDILPGTSINEANREAIARYHETFRKSNDLYKNAFFKMADQINYRKELGQPVVAYNMQPFSRKVIVEAEVYSHENPVSITPIHWIDYTDLKKIMPIDRGQGNVTSVMVRDGAGKIYPAQIVRSKVTPPGVISKVQFIDDEFPAGGYKTYYIDTDKIGTFNDRIPFHNNTFETDYFRIKVNLNTGNIVSLIDKRNNIEYVKDGEELNTLRIYMEEKGGGYIGRNNRVNAWGINNAVDTGVAEVQSVNIVENGPVRACIESVKTWGRSKFTERTYIYRSYPRIEYDIEVDWLEVGSSTGISPMLRAEFPLAINNVKFYNQVPFEILERPSHNKRGGQEVPAQKWVTVTDGQKGIALMNRSKYGHMYDGNILKISLIRSTYAPDPYPNLGRFNISYALYPHLGDWKSNVWAEGENFNIPVYAFEPLSLSLVKEYATHPEEKSFFKITSDNVALSGVKQSEDGDELIIRLIEIEGKETTTRISVPIQVNAARRLNLIELPLEKATKPAFDGSVITIKLKPHEIVTLGIK
jgi:alpha-mannosidase